MAKLADKGKIFCIFLADAAYRSSGSIGQTDPIIWISAMAAAFKNAFFGVTARTSYLTVSAAFLLT
jgi:alkanesulfonate monooxygenase SsuD/methylene tetrahydromethanopterin reductase-like flavin-dependent oxidoreductase (luciferase family)